MGEAEALLRQTYSACRARLWAGRPAPVAPEPCEVIEPEPAPAFLWKGKPYTAVAWENDKPAPQVTVRAIIEAVSVEYGVSVVEILSHRRTADIVRPRQVAMYLATKLTMKSLPEIGRCFDDRDHTTILHAARKIRGLLTADPELVALVEKLEARVSAQ